MDDRRFPRLSLTSEQFRLAENGKVFGVADLSKSGMALRILDSADLAQFPVMHEFEGTLNLNQVKVPIKAVVRNVRKDLVGCELMEQETVSQGKIGAFLDPARLGAELKAVSVEDPGHDSDKKEQTASWYHASSGTDVLIWKNESGEPVRFAIFILGSFIQLNPTEGLVTGRIAAAADVESVGTSLIRLETMILDPDLKPDPGKLEVAKTLVLSSNLAQEVQDWMIRKMAGEK